MWQYNYNYLCHADHKYIDKYKGPSGKMIYVYDKFKSALNTPIKDVFPKTAYSQSSKTFSKKPINGQSSKTKQVVSSGYVDSKRQGSSLNKTGDKVYDGEYVANHPISSIHKVDISSGRKPLIEKSKINNKNDKQMQKDREYYDSRKVQNSSKQAEREHSSKTSDIDRENKYQREKEEILNECKTKKENLRKSIEKFEQLLSSKNVRQQDLYEASKYMESYYDDYKDALKPVFAKVGGDDLKNEENDFNDLQLKIWALEDRSGIKRFARPVGDPLPEKWYGKNVYSTYSTGRVRR